MGRVPIFRSAPSAGLGQTAGAVRLWFGSSPDYCTFAVVGTEKAFYFHSVCTLPLEPRPSRRSLGFVGCCTGAKLLYLPFDWLSAVDSCLRLVAVSTLFWLRKRNPLQPLGRLPPVAASRAPGWTPGEQQGSRRPLLWSFAFLVRSLAWSGGRRTVYKSD